MNGLLIAVVVLCVVCVLLAVSALAGIAAWGLVLGAVQEYRRRRLTEEEEEYLDDLVEDILEAPRPPSWADTDHVRLARGYRALAGRR